MAAEKGDGSMTSELDDYLSKVDDEMFHEVEIATLQEKLEKAEAENAKMQTAFIHVENICMYGDDFEEKYQQIWNVIRDARGLPR
jgi:hypothetical protein